MTKKEAAEILYREKNKYVVPLRWIKFPVSLAEEKEQRDWIEAIDVALNALKEDA